MDDSVPYDEISTFSDIYAISIDEYEGTLVNDSPFSGRTINRLIGNDIATVSDLLRATPETLMKIKGFGKNCLDEVKMFCSKLKSEKTVTANTSKVNTKAVQKLMQENVEYVAFGDFSFANEASLNDEEIACLELYKCAFCNLGEELVFDCIRSPQKIIPIIEMFNEFQYEANRHREVYELEQKIIAQEKVVGQAETRLARIQIQLEEEIKKASINDISARAIIMLDKLQDVLYRRQIEKMELFFHKEMNTLMNKTHFIDGIRIDDKFNTHIYRTEDIPVEKLLNILTTNPEEQLITILGETAISNLKQISGVESIYEIINYCNRCKSSTISLPFEINKSSLSNGEKQIFIMAIYHSLVQLCNQEIPFIIDTPFARIDTEHRRNISKHFFSKLRGQVFILSTNEEIKSSHVQIMSNHISATYLLENSDNKRTIVVANSYFEV